MKILQENAKDLCEIANQYNLSASQVVEKCIRRAKSAATNSGMKKTSVSFNSKAVTLQELESATKELQSKGFTISSKRSEDGWLQIEIMFDVC